MNTTKTLRRHFKAISAPTIMVAAVLTLFLATRSSVEGSAAVTFVPESPFDTTRVEFSALPVAEQSRLIGTGQASYYGDGFAGRPTANGETFRPSAMTAAHKTLPFGTKLRITNLRNGRSVVVRVNDRGPYVAHRVIDLSEGAATKIGMISSGTARVRLEVLS